MAGDQDARLDRVEGQWRVGRKLGRTLYIVQDPDDPDGDLLVGMVDSRWLGRLVCDAVNAYQHTRPVLTVQLPAGDVTAAPAQPADGGA